MGRAKRREEARKGAERQNDIERREGREEGRRKEGRGEEKPTFLIP
jgi:hypothetical protein